MPSARRCGRCSACSPRLWHRISRRADTALSPYSCPYHEHCTRDMVAPAHGIDELPRLAASRRARLEAMGVEEIRHSRRISRCRGCSASSGGRCGRAGVWCTETSRALSGIVLPVRHLDFETFAPAIPRFAGTRPYDQIPFLFSVRARRVRAMQRMLAAPLAPDIALALSPTRPYHEHCTRDMAAPAHGMRAAEVRGVEAGGLEARRGDTGHSGGFPAERLQRIVRRAVREGRGVVPRRPGGNCAAGAPPRLRNLRPGHPALRRRPYDQIPFLFSVHTERDGAPPEHADYLHEGDDDPRPILADRLIAAAGREGTICTYSATSAGAARSRHGVAGPGAGAPRHPETAVRSASGRARRVLPPGLWGFVLDQERPAGARAGHGVWRSRGRGGADCDGSLRACARE